MHVPASLLSLNAVLIRLLHFSAQSPTPELQVLSSQSASADWFGMLPPIHEDPIVQGSMVSACTFAVGPPGPDLALCPAFLNYCRKYKESVSPHIVTLKTRAVSTTKPSMTSSPLKDVRFRAGCTGGSDWASDGTYISGYTASCIVDGTEWVSLVFDDFIRAQFSEDGTQDPAIYYSFIGCQVPAQHA